MKQTMFRYWNKRWTIHRDCYLFPGPTVATYCHM